MKKLIFISLLFLAAFHSYGQSVVPLRGDKIRIYKNGGSAELQLENSTRDTIGPLMNIGNGNTEFAAPHRVNDSTIVIGPITIITQGPGSPPGTPSGDTIYIAAAVDTVYLFNIGNLAPAQRTTWAVDGNLRTSNWGNGLFTFIRMAPDSSLYEDIDTAGLRAYLNIAVNGLISVTADNGLHTTSPTNTEMGGTLNQNTVINTTSDYVLSVVGTTTGSLGVFYAYNFNPTPGNNFGMVGQAAQGYGVAGTGLNGVLGTTNSTFGYGGNFKSDHYQAIRGENIGNEPTEVLQSNRTALVGTGYTANILELDGRRIDGSGFPTAGQAGDGELIVFRLAADDDFLTNAGDIGYAWTNATSGNTSSVFDISALTNGVQALAFSVEGTASVTYGSVYGLISTSSQFGLLVNASYSAADFVSAGPFVLTLGQSNPTNDIESNLSMIRGSASAGVAGLGSRIEYKMANASSNLVGAGSIDNQWTTTPTAAHEFSEYDFITINDGTPLQGLRIHKGTFGSGNMPTFANNAAAIAGGFDIGDFYYNGDDVKRVH